MRYFLILLVSIGPWHLAKSQTLLFNEAMTINGFFSSDDGLPYPWVEFINMSEDTIELSGFYLTSDSANLKTWTLPSLNLAPDSISLLWLSGKGGRPNHSDFQIDINADYLILTDGQQILDYIPLKSMAKNQTYGRRGGATEEKVYFIRVEDMTPGKANLDPGPWVKVQHNAAFQVGDAGYFGCLVYDDKMWILDYETLSPDESVWLDLMQVWSSSDGFNWELVNPNPPYEHAAMVTVFNGYMWAFDGRAFRSKDGIEWEQVSANTPDSERVAVFKNQLWILQNESIFRSSDGIAWEKVADAPWDYRYWPAFMEHNGKLWMFGGNINYKTGDDYYFTDVWSSEDGINWELVNNSAPWRGTIWFTYVTYDGKIWMIDGGWNYWDRQDPFNGNGNEVWYSEDGVDWRRSAAPTPWLNRHAQFTWVFKDELWIGAGYAGGGTHHLFNDIWRYSRKPNMIFVNSVLSVTYGVKTPLPTLQAFERPVMYSITDPNIATIVRDTLIPIKVGETTIVVTHEGDDFHKSATQEMKLNVAKKELTVKPVDAEIAFGEHNPEIDLDYSGFVFGEDKGVLDAVPRVTGLPKEFSPIGTYITSAEGGSDDSYNYVFQEGELTIHPSSDLAIVFPNPVENKMQILFSSIMEGPIVIELFNGTGVRVGHQVGYNIQRTEFDLSPLPPGVYILKMISKNGRKIWKIVKI